MRKMIRFMLVVAVWAAICTPCGYAGPADEPGRAVADSKSETSPEMVPKAVFPETRYLFAPVDEGKDIKHDFILYNKGNVPLVISRVRPDCGCSVASNPGRVPVGQSGTIAVRVDTSNRGGTTLHKGFTVFTNDPGNAKVRLEVTGQVRSFLMVTPKYVRFSGTPDQPMRQTVRIMPTKGHPCRIAQVSVHDSENLRYELNPLGRDPKTAGYELIVENRRRQPGRYHDLISIRTDSAVKPLITIPVTIRVRDASAHEH